MKKMIGCCAVAVVYYTLNFSALGSKAEDSFDNVITRISGAGTPLDVSAVYLFLEILVFSVIFQLAYGTTLYKNYSGVGVYFFSRTEKRRKWAFREIRIIFLKAFIYYFCIVATSLLNGYLFGARGLKKEHLRFFLIYFVTWWLFTASVTLIINVVSIAIKDNYGFAVVAMIGLLFVTLLYYFGEKYGDDLCSNWDYLVWNPITYIHFGLHSSTNAYLNSLLNIYDVESDLINMPIFWGCFSIVVVIFSAFVVEKTQLLNFSNEAEY